MDEIIDLEITTENVTDNIILFHFKGNLDGGTFSQVERIFDDSCKMGIYKFMVDLAGLEYVSSAGAGVLLGWYGVLQEKQGMLVIINPQPKVKMVFNMVGLPSVVPIVPDRAAALKLISQSPA